MMYKGYNLDFTLWHERDDSVREEVMDSLVDAFLELVESRGLTACGGYSEVDLDDSEE